LWNNLRGKYDEKGLKRALAEANVKPTARAETLDLAESAAVYRALRNPHEGS
jgi:16S rRNA A1518/A1519 N6-dimethyltransferase RsmA/KsgA/DIM1 with predicted DNA glycosylase/AP lyase activity